MKTIYLIRHCQPAFPGGRKLCIASTDLPLSQEGLEQGNALSRLEITALFASPMLRCTQTAQAMGVPFQVLEGLRERGMGQWEGLTFQQIRQRYPDLYAARGKDPTLMPPGAEDRAGALARFRQALQEAAQTAPGDFAVVTHGGILEIFWEEVTRMRHKPGYGEILTLAWENGEFDTI